VARARRRRIDSHGRRVSCHGVASGDPLADRVILWTGSTADGAHGAASVRWRIADDERLTRVVAQGTATARPSATSRSRWTRAGLRPGATYYYAFDAAGEQSPVGRTRTLPARGASRLRLAVVSCADFEKGYFNAYRNIAARPDLDAVLFLGDYIYEYSTTTPGIERVAGGCPRRRTSASASTTTAALREPPPRSRSRRRCTPRTRASRCGTTTRAPTTRGATGARGTKRSRAVGARKAAARRRSTSGCRCASRRACIAGSASAAWPT
jgi:hypothetical protein